MRYRIDPPASRFTVRAFAGGPLSAVGHNPTFAVRDFRGEVVYDPDEPGASSVRLIVGAGSLTANGSLSEKDRREVEGTTREQVLESGRFGEIVFHCPASGVTAVGPTQLTLNGELSLHGITRPETVSVRLYPAGETLRAQGDATLRQSDYGIRLVSVAGGMLKVKDEVKLAFDIMARREATDAAATPGGDAARRTSGATP